MYIAAFPKVFSLFWGYVYIGNYCLWNLEYVVIV